MRLTRKVVLGGIAAIALAGHTVAAAAGTPETHVLTLRLPDGEVEQIRYAGTVPPTVVLVPSQPDAASPLMDAASPFAMLEQMAAAMDRQAEALFRQVDASMGLGGGGLEVPVSGGPGVCLRSVQITSTGDGRAPNVVSRTVGDCGAGGEAASPATLPRPRDGAPAVVEARNARPYQGMVHTVSDWQR